MDDRAGPHEQKPFEHGMIDGMVKRGQEANHRERRQFDSHSNHPYADPHQDDADVFHTGVSQHSFQIMFIQSI